MRCSKCDEEPAGDDPTYCPHCGAEFCEKSKSDIDFPLEIQIGPRIDVRDLVRMRTGVDSDSFHNDCELLIDIVVTEDGSFHLESEIDEGDAE